MESRAYAHAQQSGRINRSDPAMALSRSWKSRPGWVNKSVRYFDPVRLANPGSGAQTNLRLQNPNEKVRERPNIDAGFSENLRFPVHVRDVCFASLEKPPL